MHFSLIPLVLASLVLADRHFVRVKRHDKCAEPWTSTAAIDAKTAFPIPTGAPTVWQSSWAWSGVAANSEDVATATHVDNKAPTYAGPGSYTLERGTSPTSDSSSFASASLDVEEPTSVVPSLPASNPTGGTLDGAGGSSTTDGNAEHGINSQSLSGYAAEMVSLHNDFRAAYGAPAVQWSDDLAATAASNTASCQAHHIANNEYGENWAWGAPFGMWNNSALFGGWADESKYYDYENPNNDQGQDVLHFTQVVWKPTTHIGCSTRDCSGQGIGAYLVCEYSPPGNVMDGSSGDQYHYFKANVGTKGSQITAGSAVGTGTDDHETSH